MHDLLVTTCDICLQSTRTLCSQIFRSLEIVHGLEGVGLLAEESLLVVIFARATDTVEEDATGGCVSEKVDNEEDEGDDDGGSEGGQQADDDAVHVVGQHGCGRASAR